MTPDDLERLCTRMEGEQKRKQDLGWALVTTALVVFIEIGRAHV